MKQCRLNGLMEFDKNVVYPFFEDEGICKGVCNALGYDVNKAFEARYKKVYEVYTLGKLKFKKFIFVCLGKKKDIDEYKYIECFREVSGHIDEDAIFVGHHAGDDQSKIAFLFMKTYLVSSYRECKVNGEDKKIADIEIFMHDGEDIEKEIKEAVCISNGVNLAKRLADTPANYMTSIDLMEEARELAERYNLEIEVLDNDALGEMGAGAILAVNQGSEYPAYIVNIKYRNGDNDLISLIGKGIIFDTGGYNLKSNSLGMKYDMSGAADVLGTMEIIASLGLNVNVDGIICVSDNMLSGNSVKPGDVVISLSEKSIEITNTDAEGRLVLCDGITYAQRNGSKYLVDIATLTGACVGALGNTYTGVFSNDDEYYKLFEDALRKANEKGWRLPLDAEYAKMLESKSADIKNSSGKREAGASVAAEFLKSFVNEGTRWIHLDIAGTSGKDAASGAMIETMCEFVKMVQQDR